MATAAESDYRTCHYVLLVYELGGDRKKKLIKVNLDDTLGDVISTHIEQKCSSVWVSKEETKNKADGTSVDDVDIPMSVIVNVFKCMYVHIICSKSEKVINEPNKPNAFSILMNARKKYESFPDERYESTNKILLKSNKSLFLSSNAAFLVHGQVVYVTNLCKFGLIDLQFIKNKVK